MAYQITKKQAIIEIRKCKKKPVYFINNYCKIPHPGKGLIAFKTYDFQDDLVNDMALHRFIVVLKARQLGISTITAAYIAWLILFEKNKNVLILATKLATAANLVKKVKIILQNIPVWMRISKLVVDNKNSLELDNGSQVKASSTSGDAGRSEALSLLVIDEAAHVEGLEDLWAALYPTIATGGRCIALSTPNGIGNWFHKTYVDAETGDNEFFPVKLKWDVHPDRDEEWLKTETKNLSKRKFAQEYDCNFNSSGDTVIDADDLEYIKNNISDPKWQTAFDRNLWIWEKPLDDETYLTTADVARGDGEDYSTLQIFKLSNMEQVAEYRGKVPTDHFAEITLNAAYEYNKSLLVVENAPIGQAVLNKLEEREYTNLYYSKKSTHDYLDYYAAQADNSSTPGFTMSTKTRPIVFAKFEELIRTKVLKINSQRLAKELETFIWKNGRPEHQRGYNDDLIVAAAIGCWVRETAISENLRDVAYKKAFLNSIIKSSTTFDSRVPGQQGNTYTERMFGEKEKIKNFLWIYKG